MFKKKLYKYVSVLYIDQFEGSKTYYYKTDIAAIKVGDFVLVDRCGYEIEARVVKVELFSKKDVPFPLDKTKDILGFIDGEIYEKSLYREKDLVLTNQGRLGGIKEIYDNNLAVIVLLDDKCKGSIILNSQEIACKINNTYTCPKCGKEMIPYYYGLVDDNIERLEEDNKIYIGTNKYYEPQNNVRYHYHCNNCDNNV